MAAPEREAVCPASLAQLPERWEFLLHEVAWDRLTDPARPVVLVGASADCDSLLPLLQAEARRLRDHLGVVLVLGTERAAGRVAGICSSRHGTSELDELLIIDAGMPHVRFRLSGTEDQSSLTDLTPWSRTIGALGEVAWRRLTALHIAVIGCERTGSLVAASLASLGVRTITLIDPDVLEVHCLGEMNGVERAVVGRHKTAALVDHLSRRTCRPDSDFRGLPESVLSLPALLAVKAADFLICCCDNALACIASAFLAKLYLKPLIDIGTGILHARNGAIHSPMGADLRLVLPERCLLCFGGIAGFEQARAEAAQSRHSASPTENSGGWRRQRAGSLQSLNQSAVGFAIRLLEELLCGRVRDSVWLQLDFDASGLPRLRQGHAERAGRCPISDVTGRGDDGVHLLHSALG